LWQDAQLSFFGFEDAVNLSMANRFMNHMFAKAKALKKVIRFGNLDSQHRAAYWRHISN